MTYAQQDLLEKYSQIDRAKSRIAALESALNAAKQSEGVAMVDTVTPLKIELQSYLVNAALGNDSEKDIARLEKAITEAAASDSKGNKAVLILDKRRLETIEGLEGRLAEERPALSELERDASVIKRDLLADQARLLAVEYSERAQAALLSLKRLMALDLVVSANNGGRASGELPNTMWTLALPRAKGMPALPFDQPSGAQFVDKESWQISVDYELESLKNELVEAGFRL